MKKKTDYKKIEIHCQANSLVSKSLIDDFLLRFIADREGLDKKFALKLTKHKDLVRKMPGDWVEWALGQYIAHCIFKEGGLACKVADHPAIKGRSGAERELFQFHLEHPWRFSFCDIRTQPAEGFFDMRDILTGETFLLNSHSISNILDATPGVRSFLLLMGYNGMCWQTYSLLAPFNGFQPFDFFYFAKQLNPNIDFPSDAQAVVEKDPVPFMLLFSGSQFPITLSRNEVIAHCYSEYYVDDFEPSSYEESFLIDKKEPVYRLRLKGHEGFPHLAACYFHRKKKRLILTAMTSTGYGKLAGALNRTGYDYPQQPDVMATIAMLTTAKQILRRDFDVDPYGKLFQEKSSPEDKQELKKLNVFISLVMNARNKGGKYDIKEMARKAGIDPETAEDVARQVLEKFDSLPGERG